MKRIPHLAVVLALVLFSRGIAAAADKIDLDRVTPVPANQPIPTQDFFRPRILSEPTLNRSGTHIAAVINAAEDRQMLLIYDIKTAKVETLTGEGDREIYDVRWLNNSRLLFRLATQKAYGLGLMGADVGKLSAAYPVQQYSGSSLVSIPLKNPLQPLVWNRSDFESGRDDGVNQLNTNIQSGYLVNLYKSNANSELWDLARENNRKRVVATYPQPQGVALTYGYMADKVGELAYAFRADKGNLSLLRFADNKWLPSPVDLESVDIIGNANEPGQLLVRGPAADGKARPLQLMDPATGKLGDIVLQDPLYDFNGSIYRNRATGDVLGTTFNKNGPRMIWFNEDYRNLQKALDGMFPKQIVRIYDNDDSHKIFLVATYSDKSPAAYHWVNLETRQAGLFKQSAPWIDPQRMQPMQILAFKTRDGQKLDAYLTLPAETSKTNPAPLVVLCHGGPWARDSWGFDGEAQFLAHHGYAVLQPNYRGSTGSVGRFPADDEYDFVKMHDDVTDALKTVLATGLVDAGRVGIMGGSFGGYLAVSGVAHEPALYRCAVTNAGVFDWTLQVLSEKYDEGYSPFYGRMVKKLGDPKKEVAKYEAMSPIKHVRNIRVPVFVAGGKDDQVVELQQSRKLIAELERNNIPHEKFFVGGEGHGMAFVKHEVELHDRILAFLDQNLKPAK